MSIEKREGRGYRVEWREGGHRRSRTFTRKGDAQVFEADLKRRKQLGPLAGTVMVSKMTLADFMREEWWPRYAVPNLDATTRQRYLEVWEHDLLDRVGGYPLREITPPLIEDLREQLAMQGLAVASQRKALFLLSAILKRAVVRQLIPPVNPVSLIDMPKAPPSRAPVPLAPETVERVRQIMLAPKLPTPKGRGVSFDRRHGKWKGQATGGDGVRRTVGWYDSETAAVNAVQAFRARQVPARGALPTNRRRDAMIVSMMAYAGLRPMEDRSATWGDVRGDSLYVFATKTKRERNVDLLPPLKQDLAEWRMACGRPGDGELIIPRPSGGEWTKNDWDNWRSRVWRPAAIEAGVTGDLRPYRLRGSFISLLLWSGMDLVEVADQAGHSVATLAKHYAGTIKELKGQPKVPAAEAIRRARDDASGQLRLVAR